MFKPLKVYHVGRMYHLGTMNVEIKMFYLIVLDLQALR